MAYIRDNLMDGERLIYRTKLHPIILFAPFFWAALSWVGAFAMLDTKLIAPVALISLILTLRLLGRILWFVSSEYGVTTKRVLGKTGLIWRNSLDLVLTKVEAVRLKQSLLGRILNYGRIEVIGTGGTEELLEFIPQPLKFRNRIQEQVTHQFENRTDDRVRYVVSSTA